MDETKRKQKRAKRRRERANWGWKLALLGAVVFLLEIPLPPIPPVMAVPCALGCLVIAGQLFWMAKRLPIREALLVAQLHNGQLSVSLLCTELDVDLVVAEAILHEMERRSVVRLEEEPLLNDGELIYRVQGFLPSEESEGHDG